MPSHPTQPWGSEQGWKVHTVDDTATWLKLSRSGPGPCLEGEPLGEALWSVAPSFIMQGRQDLNMATSESFLLMHFRAQGKHAHPSAQARKPENSHLVSCVDEAAKGQVSVH